MKKKMKKIIINKLLKKMMKGIKVKLKQKKVK